MADETRGTRAGARRRRPGGPRGRRRKPRERRKGWRIALWTTTAVVVLGGSGVGYAYFKLNGNLHGVDINSALGTDRPDNVDNGSQDILVLGSDSRAGANGQYGRDEGSARSDTAMIVHVYAGHKKASVVSIPRGHHGSPPRVQDARRQGEPGRQAGPVQRRLLGRRRGLRGQDRRGHDRDPHGPLPGSGTSHGFQKLIDKLGGVGGHHHQADPRPRTATSTCPRAATGSTASSRWGWCAPGTASATAATWAASSMQQAFIKALIDQVKSVGLFTNPAKLYGIADTPPRRSPPIPIWPRSTSCSPSPTGSRASAPATCT
ncbi:hypothetical protein GCM10020221_02130 [Streptomyces thioluteus]|uniref:Cell envelope-related transcriptional attenuator domain-containing protein n=1 Tax=Streptomyces thioluteus TaxID=66431 RepID=A0ABP6IUE3_STRTU